MSPPSPPAPHQAEESHRTKGLLRLTMACNERCPFCNVPAEDYPRPTPTEEEQNIELDDFIASGERTLTISGGEPTLLRRRLLSVIRRARGAGVPFVELQTNAVLIDEGYAAALAEAGLTSAFVSLLSHEPAHHDALAGLKGAFARCLRGIDALLGVGVRVALNPVTARRTQTLLPDYLRFVAARLPGVRSVSLSAVQPHGRARQHLSELLPDYDVLRDVVPEAQRVAAAAGIELLNPYCGLPLCVGWAADMARSVEAIEAEGGGWRPLPGIENRDDKTQGPPCQACALRTRCGGAWRAVWTERGGAGLHPPLRRVAPWEPGAEAAPGQQIFRAPGRPTPAQLSAARASVQPTVWLVVGALTEDDVPLLMSSGCTDLCLCLQTAALEAAGPAIAQTLRALHRLLRLGVGAPDHGRLLVHLRLEGQGGPATSQLAAWATARGAATVHRGP